jgi:hypothetical protein
MTASAQAGGRPGWIACGLPTVWTCLLTAVSVAAIAAADEPQPADDAVTISDGLLDALPAPTDGFAGVEQAVGAEECHPVGAPTLDIASQCCGPRWDVAVDAIMLWQGNAPNLPLLLDAAGATALDAGNLRTPMGVGPRVSLIRYLGSCDAIEGNYFRAQPFDITRQAPAAGGPYSLINMGDITYTDIESALVNSSGAIQSAEINWRRNPCGCPLTWITGFRWVELNSQFGVDYVFENPVPYGSGSIRSETGNSLFGGQIGADLCLVNKMDIWKFNTVGKAGVFYNDAYQRSVAEYVETGVGPVSAGIVSASADQTAFFGEVGLNSTYWITRCLAWRVGYTVFWASGVAVAAEQLPVNSFSSGTTIVDASSVVMLHGVTTGLEFCW